MVIYDALGRRVRTLASARYPAGVHEVRWDGRGDRGERVSSGVYYCRMRTGGEALSRAMVLIK